MMKITASEFGTSTEGDQSCIHCLHEEVCYRLKQIRELSQGKIELSFECPDYKQATPGTEHDDKRCRNYDTACLTCIAAFQRWKETNNAGNQNRSKAQKR